MRTHSTQLLTCWQGNVAHILLIKTANNLFKPQKQKNIYIAAKRTCAYNFITVGGVLCIDTSKLFTLSVTMINDLKIYCFLCYNGGDSVFFSFFFFIKFLLNKNFMNRKINK